MKPLRTAIIGCGNFAKRHANILVTLDDIKLVGFCDQKIESATAFSQQYGGGAVYTNFARMFAELDLDLAYICLPPYAHTNEVELACQHGVHFLIEKPIALDMDLACKMAAQVKARGVKSQVGFMYRYGEAALWLKQRLQEAGPNTPAFMLGRYACNALHSPWWRDRSKSGGQLVEQVIHVVDLTRYFLGEPVEVYSVQQNLFHRHVPDYTVEDVSATVIRFASGSVATISATNGAIPRRWDCDWRLVMAGLTADFQNPNNAVFTMTDKPWPSTTTITSEKDMYLAETLDLIAAVRDNRPTAVPIEEGVRSLDLALAAARSAELGAPVRIALSMCVG
jgi:predicted dehydrogenase